MHITVFNIQCMTMNFLMTLFGVLKGLASEQWVAEKFTIHGVSLVCLWHIMLLKNHLDSCTNASKTLSPSLELVSKNVALCSRASFSPFSEVTHLHPWSMRSERKSSLLPHNMIGILFSDTSCKNDKKYILKKIREIEILHIWDRRSGWLIHELDLGLRILIVYHGEMGKYHSLINKSSTIMPRVWQIRRNSLFTLPQRY